MGGLRIAPNAEVGRCPEALKPDFKSGFPASNLPDGGMVTGQVDGEDVILARQGDEFFAVGAYLHALSRTACRRLGGGRHGALSVAPRLFQPANRRGAARSGARSDCLLARRKGGRHGLRSGEARSSRRRTRRESGESGQGATAPLRRDRGRRRGGARGGRHAPSRGL